MIIWNTIGLLLFIAAMKRMMVVRDSNGWQMIVLKEVSGGVIVNWDFVEEGKTRFIQHGEYKVVSNS